jgi:hypothetical protein
MSWCEGLRQEGSDRAVTDRPPGEGEGGCLCGFPGFQETFPAAFLTGCNTQRKAANVVKNREHGGQNPNSKNPFRPPRFAPTRR